MSLLDRAIANPCALKRRTYPHVPLLRDASIRRRCCFAKIEQDNEEQELGAPHRFFSIRVPTIPKIGDIESARRLLESAFHNLSFDMSKIPIDAALQSLPFGIPKLSISIPVMVLDITGFVVTKLKKPQKKDLEDFSVVEEGEYPRCAWPRTLKGAQAVEVASIGLLEKPHKQEISHEIPVGPHCAWPRVTPQPARVSGSSMSGSVLMYPHSSWPKATPHPAKVSVPLLPSSVVTYPRSAWPRGSIPANSAAFTSEELSERQEEGTFPRIIEGGPRCAWPRKRVSSKQNCYAARSADNAEVCESEDRSGSKLPPAQSDESAELPRRIIATSVGLTVMNYLAQSSIMTSFFDLCSSLPAGISEEEGAAMDVGRRTLLVFIKSSGR